MMDPGRANILGIDTSSHQLHLGLAFGGDRLVKSTEEVGQSHGQVIVKKIAELFESAGMAREELGGICVCLGPGSFTGLRIGLAAAKGMAVALGIPVVGVSLFEIAAYKLGYVDEEVAVVIPLKRDEFFLAKVAGGKVISDRIRVVPTDSLGELIAEGAAAGFGFGLSEMFALRHGEDLSEAVRYDGGDLIHLGREKLVSGVVGDLTSLEPLYIQKSKAEIRFERGNRA
jgi:tRNA threonylcarbamoyladenosine biosynthesis protein TsaB